MSEEEIQVVRKASCPSISGTSTITYEIGSKGDCQFIRLEKSDNGGLCCRDWIPIADIQQLLAGIPKPTSKTLLPIYAGKSANSPGFLLACILHEKPGGNYGVPADPETPPQKKPGNVKKSKNDGGN